MTHGSSRSRWKARAALLVIAAVVLPLAGYLVISMCLGYQPTGDELFDRTARWLLQQNRRMSDEPNAIQEWLYHNTSWYEFPMHTLDLSEPVSWQDSYPDDPRYRQLMWQIDRLGNLVDPGQIMGFEAMPEWQRRETLAAAGGGPADYALLRWRTGNMREVAQEEVTEEGEREIALLLELADQAIALDPDNSYFYYKKADVLASLGELDQAWGLVKTGNAAPLNYVPLPFPLNELMEHRDELTSPQSKTAAALIWLMYAVDQLSRGIWAKERYKEIDCAIALGYPMELADAYLARALRMAEMDNQTAYGQTAALILYQIPLHYAVDYGILDLSPAQRRGFEHLMQVCDDASGRFEPYVRDYGFPYSSRDRGYVSPVIPLSGIRITPQVWDLILEDYEAVARGCQEVQILDPPPLAIWARGELVGIETGGIVEAATGGGET